MKNDEVLLKTDFYFCLYTDFCTYFYILTIQAQSPKFFFTFSQSNLIFETFLKF